jgi:hypothetical protein
MTKYLSLILSIIDLSKGSNKNNSEMAPMEVIKKVIRGELQTISYKIFLGLILTFIVTYTFVQLGDNLQIALTQYKYELLLKNIIFGSILLTCFISMYFLFNNKQEKELLNKVKEKNLLRDDEINLLISQFVEGFSIGFSDEVIVNNQETFESNKSQEKEFTEPLQ